MGDPRHHDDVWRWDVRVVSINKRLRSGSAESKVVDIRVEHVTGEAIGVMLYMGW
jgi:hypothetical protein